MVRYGTIFVERGSAEGTRHGFHISQDWCSGAGQCRAYDLAESTLYWLVRMERLLRECNQNARERACGQRSLDFFAAASDQFGALQSRERLIEAIDSATALPDTLASFASVAS